MSQHRLNLTGSQKVAALVAQLPVDFQSALLRQFSDTESVHLLTEVANLPLISTADLEAIVDEIRQNIELRTAIKQGGMAAAEELLIIKFGRDRAAEYLDRLRELGADEAPLDFLNRIDPQQLVGVCTNENPQAVAIILAHLHRSLASDVLQKLPEEVRGEIIYRITRLGALPTSVLNRMSNVLNDRLSTFLRTGATTSAVDGVSVAVGILSGTERGTEKQIISSLDERDPDTAERVRAEMFGWEDVLQLDDRSIQVVLRDITMHDLAIALRGKDDMRVPGGIEAVFNFFRRNLGERQVEELLEEIDALPKQRLTAVEAAEGLIVRTVRQKADAGEI
ncbi:MAG TPA: FliG C-terminal domain-containing protein, partial [Acidimicrobiales bacterium]|nr:FliG C-terminal domain-containing protein [Acidimicrobiales bacterium]